MANLNKLQPVQTLKPFTKFCCSIGAIPSSYLVSLTYEEQLLWLCDYLQNTIIPTINNNGCAVTELQNLYVQLKNYVDNYFTNLNVQNEINNKLDEMVTDGTFDTIINKTLFNNMNFTFNTLQDAKNFTSFVIGNKFTTQGYNSINDGGNATYQIIEDTQDPLINIDNGKYISLPNNLIAEQIIDKQINILTYGTTLDDYASAINNALKYANTIFFPTGTYKILSPINLSSSQSLIGATQKPTINIQQNTFVNLSNRNTIKNFNIMETSVNNPQNSTFITETPAFITGSMGYSIIEDVNIGNAYIGIDITSNGHSSIKNINGVPLKYGIKITNTVDIIYMDNINFNPNYFGKPNLIYLNYMFNNGFGFYIGRADWGYITNSFVFGYCALCYTDSATIGGSANNFTFNNFGCDACKNLFIFNHNAGGFKFINGNCTFYNPWYTELAEAGLNPKNASTYPITINLSSTSQYETNFCEILNTNFYRADFQLALIQGNTNFIFKGNHIKNMFQRSSLTSVDPIIKCAGNSILSENTIINKESLTGTKQGIYCENSKIIVANNNIQGLSQPIPNPGNSTFINNNYTSN